MTKRQKGYTVKVSPDHKCVNLNRTTELAVIDGVLRNGDKVLGTFITGIFQVCVCNECGKKEWRPLAKLRMTEDGQATTVEGI